VVHRLKCVIDADGKHSALFACIAELFQHLDIEVITVFLFARVELMELCHDTDELAAFLHAVHLCQITLNIAVQKMHSVLEMQALLSALSKMHMICKWSS